MEEPRKARPVTLAVTPRFRQRVRKLTPEEQRALVRSLRLFEHNPADPRLETHKLRGQHEGRWAFSCGYDARVVFSWDGSIAVLLDVGTHDEVYG